MKKEPQRNSAQFSLDLLHWWNEQIAQRGESMRESWLEVSRDKKLVGVDFTGYRYLLGFGDPLEDRFVQDFSVCAVGTPRSLIEPVKSAVVEYKSAFEGREINIFHRIFGKKPHRVDFGDFVFQGKPYDGVRITVPIVNVPYGKEKGLSSNLFIYFRKGVLGPLHNVVQGTIEPQKGHWFI